MKKIVLGLLVALNIAALAGCRRAQTGDPVSDGALNAFNTLVAQNKDRKGFHDALKHWGLSLPGNDKFEWTKDTAAGELDFAMVMAAEPFLNAGLTVSMLTNSGYLFKEATMEDGKPVPDLLIHPYNVSDKKETAQGSEDAMRRVLKQAPALVSYHEEQQCYRLVLSEGFAVQWTQEPGLNDADIVFVIAADPLIAAGLDVAKLKNSGWVYKEAGEESAMGADLNQLVKIYSFAAGN